MSIERSTDARGRVKITCSPARSVHGSPSLSSFSPAIAPRDLATFASNAASRSVVLPKTFGRPAVVKRTFEGTTRYAALLVGLSPNDAGEACRMLWHRAQYCLALNPTVLNDPRALWR